jgi:DNA-binding response OmpR family regulator
MSKPAVPGRQELAPQSMTPSVLIVDDEISIRTAMRRYFARRGWKVSEAPDGVTAQRLLDPTAGNDFDVVICDLRMPRFSGSDLHRWLQRNRPGAVERLVFSSGDVMSPEVAVFLERAQRPVLPKPFDLKELGRIVDEVYRAAHAA